MVDWVAFNENGQSHGWLSDLMRMAKVMVDWVAFNENGQSHGWLSGF